MIQPTMTNAERSQTEALRPTAHDAQGEALARLRAVLDTSGAALASAREQRHAAISAAQTRLNRALTAANEAHAATLEQIERQVATTRAEIDQRHETKLLAARQEHAAALEAARETHKRATGKARKQRDEAIWLADTMVESATPKIRNAYEAAKGQAREHTARLDALEAELIRLLGPRLAERVAAAQTPPTEIPDTPTTTGLEQSIASAAESVTALTKGGALKVFRGKEKTLELGMQARARIADARAYAEALLNHAALQRDTELRMIEEAKAKEIELATRAAKLAIAEADKALGQIVREQDEALAARTAELDQRRERDFAEVERWRVQQTRIANATHESARNNAAATHAATLQDAESAYHAIEAAARDEAVRVAEETRRILQTITNSVTSSHPDWSDPVWTTRPHPRHTPGLLPIADAALDLSARLANFDEAQRETLALPETLHTPVVLDLPGPSSLLIRHDTAGRDTALSALRNHMLRILASFPAGKVRFTMADPIGLGQSFAGFMRLADQEPSPVGLRIWSDPNQIERQLADLTEHMQTVIQKYLRADYETIEDYNHAAGEIAEPYRFVIIADLPNALTESGAARLNSILESGPRCGVYALLATPTNEKLPSTLPDDTLREHAVTLSITNDTPRIDDPRFEELTLTLETEPSDAFAADLLDRIAQAGAEAGRVEVPFERLVPDDANLWSRSASEELAVPLGRSGAQKIQHLKLGHGTRQHALIAGRTGSGKSTLLHVMITAAALWHSPDELEMYLIDFKKGVEFKAYATGRVPHIRAVAIESDREFGLSVLKRLDDELTARGDLFRKVGAQNLAAARQMEPSKPLPRIMLMIDEFQEFFTEDDDLASEASLLLDRLVRQGRAFGVHVILGSQTLAGAYSLARSTLGQIGVRIALQCSEADSYLILGEDNNAARLLSRPGEAIYNDAGGLVEGNSPFQTAWLPDADRDAQLKRLPEPTGDRPAPVVFEGNAPAKIDLSAKALAHAFPDRSIPRALLGDAVAIAPPVAAVLRKRSGANLIVVGPQPEPALGMLTAAAITAGSTPNARTILIDPTPEDDALAGRAASALTASGIRADTHTHLDANRLIAEIDAIVRERQSTPAGEPILLVLAGLHRLRSLRKSDDYSFSLDEHAGTSPDKQLANILREGPAVGVWTLAWCDTLTNLERAMDRSTIREFGLRALMQMGASDSSALIDSSAAANLGVNRALLADDEAGTLTRFRPVDLPTPDAARRAGVSLAPE